VLNQIDHVFKIEPKDKKRSKNSYKSLNNCVARNQVQTSVTYIKNTDHLQQSCIHLLLWARFRNLPWSKKEIRKNRPVQL